MYEKVHITREGKEIPLKDLKDSHLLNILKYHHKQAEAGVVTGSAWFGEVDADVLYGEEVLDRYNHGDYVREACRRGLSLPCACSCESGGGVEFFGTARFRLKG